MDGINDGQGPDLITAVLTVLYSLYHLPAFQTAEQVSAALTQQGYVHDPASLPQAIGDCRRLLEQAPVTVTVCRGSSCQAGRHEALPLRTLARWTTQGPAAWQPGPCQNHCRLGPNAQVRLGQEIVQFTSLATRQDMAALRDYVNRVLQSGSLAEDAGPLQNRRLPVE